MAARIPHPDWAAVGAAFGFMCKNIYNNSQLSPDSPLKQDVNRYGPPGGYFSFINWRGRKILINLKKFHKSCILKR